MPAETDARTRALLDSLLSHRDGEPQNLMWTLAHHPRLLKRWSALGGTLLFRGLLPARDRELLILRTAWWCRADYEWAHHVRLARSAGVTDDEIGRVTGEIDESAWAPSEAALLRAVDELHRRARIGDDTWAVLASRYRPSQLIEICMVVGMYHLVAFTANSLGIEVESPLEER